MSSELDRIVNALDEESTSDQVLDAWHRVKAARDHLKLLGGKLEEAMIAWIKANGDLDDGKARFYVAEPKKEVVQQPRVLLRECLEQALSTASGDTESACALLLDEVLASSCFRLGSVKQFVGEEVFDFCVQTLRGEEVKEGKTRLGRIDEITARRMEQARKNRKARAEKALAQGE